MGPAFGGAGRRPERPRPQQEPRPPRGSARPAPALWPGLRCMSQAGAGSRGQARPSKGSLVSPGKGGARRPDPSCLPTEGGETWPTLLSPSRPPQLGPQGVLCRGSGQRQDTLPGGEGGEALVPGAGGTETAAQPCGPSHEGRGAPTAPQASLPQSWGPTNTLMGTEDKALDNPRGRGHWARGSRQGWGQVRRLRPRKRWGSGERGCVNQRWGEG